MAKRILEIGNFLPFMGIITALVVAVVIYLEEAGKIKLEYCPSANTPCVVFEYILYILIWATFLAVVIIMLFAGLDLIGLSLNHIKKKVDFWRKTPKLKHRFLLPSNNNLELQIFNSKFAKAVYAEFFFRGYMDILGRNYYDSHQEELITRVFRQSIDPAIVRINLAPNTRKEMEVGISRDGKIELQINGFYVSGFRDGTYNYRVGCNGKYLGKEFSLPDFSVWLTILDGALIEIKDKL